MVDDELDITFSVKTALALLDIRMPNMDGFQLCRKLMEVDNKIKICFLTAAELTYYREKNQILSIS